MAHFELSIHIQRPPEVCFAFIRDKDMFEQEPGSPVLRLDKVTAGPVQVGTRFFEVVQMFPLVRAEIHSTVMRYDPPEWLEESFHSGGMEGLISYQFISKEGGTYLVQREQWRMRGLLRIFEPFMARMLSARLQWRLEGIKRVLEGWQASDNLRV